MKYYINDGFWFEVSKEMFSKYMKNLGKSGIFCKIITKETSTGKTELYVTEYGEHIKGKIIYSNL